MGSACAGNYKCDSSFSFKNSTGTAGSDNSSFWTDHVCSLETLDEEGNIKSISRMPRYTLVDSSAKQLKMRGFPIILNNNTNKITSRIQFTKKSAKQDVQKVPTIAYYSNMEQWGLSASIDKQIQIVVIVIHGSSRDADEYIYAGMAASQIQTTYSPENVLVIAPRFLVPGDGVNHLPVQIGKMVHIMPTLMWNETDPIPHTWRYGANALPPFSNISSYDVMDALVEHFAFDAGQGKRYTNLEKIVAIGHSAGGQFTHRWALTSNSPAWDGGMEVNSHINVDIDRRAVPMQKQRQRRKLVDREKNMKNNHHRSLGSQIPRVKAVAANPRSFCYLDSRRFIDGMFEIPPVSMIERCPNYNRWEWGLDRGGELPTPYKDRAVDFFGGDTSKLIKRYAKRDVIYLAGNNDTKPLHSECEDDDFQGKFRRERSEKFYSSLKEIFGSQVHSRSVIDDVGHDHSLIFASKEGIEAIFGS